MTKVTDTESKAEIAKAAFTEIKPPEHIEMQERDMPYFHNVIDEFAKIDWSQHQLELAALLARTMSDYERDQRVLREDGGVIFTEKGTPIVNPLKTIVQMHGSTILQMRKSLALDARGMKGDGRDIAKKRSTAKFIENDITKQMNDSLLARPN